MQRFKSKRGSILLVTMIFAGAIAIFLGTYLTISVTALQMSNRSVYANTASNLVDTGLDEVMWVLNHDAQNWTGAGFASATVNGVTGYRKTFDYSSHLSNGLAGKVNVWVNPNVSVPVNGVPTTGIQTVAEAVLTLPATSINTTQAPIIKEAEAYMVPSSVFPGSIIAKKSVNMNGLIDSYNSNNGPYDPATARANAEVGSPDVLINSVNVGQAKIAGGVLVGGSSNSGDLTLGTKGSVGDANWVANQTGVETGHATYNFTTSFPDVTTPSPTTVNTISSGINGGSTTLPRAGDSAVTVSGVTTYFYNINSISLNGNGDTVNIGASSSSKVNVVIILTNPMTDISIGGKGSLNIASGSNLTMYAPGSVSIGGNGVLNGGSSDSTVNPPTSFQVYGTQTAAQTAASGSDQNISISGNGVLSGAIYAPNASISLNGGGSAGEVLGAMVGDLVTINGSHYPFHYDEALANLPNPNGLWTATKYRELFNASDRAVYAAYFPSQ
ncbi:MAG TPA: hypothetical protein VNW30_04990 [Opitutaceae bacterium]|nr:hypothetical protein [Opitutaceae bacterium]